MSIYIAVNSDGSEIISKEPLKRFYNIERSMEEDDAFSREDTQLPPHWMVAHKRGRGMIVPVDVYITLPSGSLEKMFGLSLAWEDEAMELDIETFERACPSSAISDFDTFWREYDKKVERRKTEALWNRLSRRDRKAAMDYLPLYKQTKPDKQFRKNPAVFLRGRTWEDELIGLPKETEKQQTPVSEAAPPTRDEFGSRINADISQEEHRAFALLKEDLLKAWSRHRDAQNEPSLRQLLANLELTSINDQSRCICLRSSGTAFNRQDTVPWFWMPEMFDRLVASRFNGYGWNVKNS